MQGVGGERLPVHASRFYTSSPRPRPAPITRAYVRGARHVIQASGVGTPGTGGKSTSRGARRPACKPLFPRIRIFPVSFPCLRISEFKGGMLKKGVSLAWCAHSTHGTAARALHARVRILLLSQQAQVGGETEESRLRRTQGQGRCRAPQTNQAHHLCRRAPRPALSKTKTRKPRSRLCRSRPGNAHFEFRSGNLISNKRQTCSCERPRSSATPRP